MATEQIDIRFKEREDIVRLKQALGKVRAIFKSYGFDSVSRNGLY